MGVCVPACVCVCERGRLTEKVGRKCVQSFSKPQCIFRHFNAAWTNFLQIFFFPPKMFSIRNSVFLIGLKYLAKCLIHPCLVIMPLCAWSFWTEYLIWLGAWMSLPLIKREIALVKKRQYGNYVFIPMIGPCWPCQVRNAPWCLHTCVYSSGVGKYSPGQEGSFIYFSG